MMRWMMRWIVSVTMQNANTAPVSENVEQEIEQPALIQPLRTGAINAGGRWTWQSRR